MSTTSPLDPEAGMPLAPFEEVGRSEAARYARWSASAAS